MIDPLLPRDFLAGKRLGISASTGDPDIDRLGLSPRHFRLALGELARLVLVGGGTLAWGGNLAPEGLTPFLIDEVRRYGGEAGGSLLVFLAWSEHRRISGEEINRVRDTLGKHGAVVCLDPKGDEIDPFAGRGDAPVPVTDPDVVAVGLTALRRVLCSQTAGRLMIGGKRMGFTGRMPGVVEEALLTLEADQPLYLAAGFGGATADIATVLGLETAGLPAAAPADPRLIAGLEAVRTMGGIHPLRTGLDPAGLASLTRTHRPSEIAVLVSRGLGDLFAKR